MGRSKKDRRLIGEGGASYLQVLASISVHEGGCSLSPRSERVTAPARGVEPHDAPDHRLRFPAQPAACTVDMDLLPQPPSHAAPAPPSALGLVCRLPHNGVEKGAGPAAS